MVDYVRPAAAWVALPTKSTPISSAWLNGVDDSCADLGSSAGRVKVTEGQSKALFDMWDPPIPTGEWICTTAPHSTATSAPANNQMRASPWVVLRTLSIDRMLVEVTIAGETGAKYRPVLYADNGFGYPGALVLDGGQLAADAIASPQATVSKTLTPGLYWIGGVTQSAPTTQPTLRYQNATTFPVRMRMGTSLLGGGTGVGCYIQASVSGSAPANWTTSVSIGGSAARIFVRTA